MVKTGLDPTMTKEQIEKMRVLEGKDDDKISKQVSHADTDTLFVI